MPRTASTRRNWTRWTFAFVALVHRLLRVSRRHTRLLIVALSLAFLFYMLWLHLVLHASVRVGTRRWVCKRTWNILSVSLQHKFIFRTAKASLSVAVRPLGCAFILYFHFQYQNVKFAHYLTSCWLALH